MIKACIQCGYTLPLTDFYRQKGMADGHLKKCKACTKANVAAYRRDNPDAVRERKLAWARSPNGKAAARRCYVGYKATQPEKIYAVSAVNNAIKTGKLMRQPCFICGESNAQAHHAHYALPLAVTWLCKKHHVQTHQLARQLKRKEA